MTESNVPPAGDVGSQGGQGAVPPPPPPPPESGPPPVPPPPIPPTGGVGPTGYPGAYSGPAPDSNAKNMAMLSHLLAIFTAFIGPLVIWLLQKDQHPFIEDQAKESLNFQITVLIAYAVAGVTTCIGIGLILMPIVWVGSMVLCIMACVEASKGVAYRYPWTLRLVN